VAHACDSNYSRGRDQEDHSSKPAQANSSQEKKKITKKGWWSVAQDIGPEFKPQYQKKKKRINV
jgi:hypothetical protein